MDKIEACGIEVSAKELVVALSGKKGEAVLRRFANTASGHRQLLHALTRGGRRVRACMEATGVYGLDVALLLSAHAGIELMVANPRAVRHFAKATMQRSKNDQLDAVLLREFVRRMEFTAWTRPDPSTLALWAMARRLEALTKLCTAEKNRQHAAAVSQAMPACVRASVARTLRLLLREIKKLRETARQCIAGDARLQRRYQLLRTMPGIGPISAIQILAELALLPTDRDVRQWVAYAGLDPREHSSGSSVKQYTRISKVGNRHLRCALYMPPWSPANANHISEGFMNTWWQQEKRNYKRLPPWHGKCCTPSSECSGRISPMMATMYIRCQSQPQLFKLKN
jgi:transposase